MLDYILFINLVHSSKHSALNKFSLFIIKASCLEYNCIMLQYAVSVKEGNTRNDICALLLFQISFQIYFWAESYPLFQHNNNFPSSWWNRYCISFELNWCSWKTITKNLSIGNVQHFCKRHTWSTHCSFNWFI